MDPNQRICPGCSETITYQSSKSATKAEKKRSICNKCKYSHRSSNRETRCPLCDFSSKKLTKFNEHVVKQHNKTLKELWDELNNGPVKCACGCDEVTRWISWSDGYSRLLVGHNANLVSFYGEEGAELVLRKRKEKLTGKTGWAKGLSKETDDRIKIRSIATSMGMKRAFEEGKMIPWAKNKTKDTDERLRVASSRQKERYASGELTPWAKGLTKETDIRVKVMAEKVSLAHKNLSVRKRLDELKRLKANEIKERIEASGKLRLIEESIGDYINDNTPNVVAECIVCGTRTTGTLRRLKYGRCYNCDPGGSVAQHEVSSWIKSLGVEVEVNKRNIVSGIEIDIYAPHKKLGIEYNGLYWHSLLNKSMTYHDNKTQACKAAGVKLIHVFEDEWRDKKRIVQSMIKHRLGLTTRKLHGRECKLVELNNKERRDFFTENHIDGDTQARIAWGLKHEGEVVAALSLRSPFHKKHKDSLEVARFCTKTETGVTGGLGKLTKAAVSWVKGQGYVSLMSYVDERFGSSHGWNTAGWVESGETQPRFWWTDFANRFNRFRYKADPSRGMTEAQVAEEAGVTKIYGSRNSVYVVNVVAP